MSISLHQYRSILRMHIRHARDEKRLGCSLLYARSVERIRLMWKAR